MSASSEGNNFNTILAHKLEISDDMVVQEVGWDEDCDSSISEAIEDIIGSALLEDTSYDVCDAILFWWRDGDGDLTDDLVDVVVRFPMGESCGSPLQKLGSQTLSIPLKLRRVPTLPAFPKRPHPLLTIGL